MRSVIQKYKEDDDPVVLARPEDATKETLIDYCWELKDNKTLNLYEYGRKVASFRQKDLPFLTFLNHDCGDCANDLFEHLAYDPDKMNYSYEEWKSFRQFMREGDIEGLRNAVHSSMRPYVTVKDSMIAAAGADICEATLHDEDDLRHTVEFCCYHKDHFDIRSNYNEVCLQLPRCRDQVHGVIQNGRDYSAKGMRDKIVSFLHAHSDFLKRASEYISMDKAVLDKEDENRKKGKLLDKGTKEIMDAYPDTVGILRYSKDTLRNAVYADMSREAQLKSFKNLGR